MFDIFTHSIGYETCNLYFLGILLMQCTTMVKHRFEETSKSAWGDDMFGSLVSGLQLYIMKTSSQRFSHKSNKKVQNL